MRRLARMQLFLGVACGTPLMSTSAALANDSTPQGLLTRGFLAVVRGDTKRAGELLGVIHARLEREKRAPGQGVEVLETWLGARRAAWRRAAETLAALARGGEPPDADVSPVFVRWITSEVYRALGEPDSATAYLELTLSPAGLFWERSLDSRLLSPFAHQRLVLAYARMGRIADAARHLATLDRDLARPDPDVRRSLEEARAALTSAQAMARRSR